MSFLAEKLWGKEIEGKHAYLFFTQNDVGIFQ